MISSANNIKVPRIRYIAGLVPERNCVMSDVKPVQLSQIGQVAIIVQDIDRATRFYREILGMKYLFSAGSLSFFDCAGVRLMLTIPESKETQQASSILYFNVEDINSAHRSLAARNVRFEGKPHMIARMPDHELWMAFFRDSENNLLALMTEVRK
jgi:methylmalonyl-CoA/ethylmalonyl-CoA epimerase